MHAILTWSFPPELVLWSDTMLFVWSGGEARARLRKGGSAFRIEGFMSDLEESGDLDAFWRENDKGPKLTIDHDYRSMGEGNNRSTHTLWCRSPAKRAEAILGKTRFHTFYFSYSKILRVLGLERRSKNSFRDL
ncbi:hypothetical protein F2Q68_00006775 [Brassica cretica]|uniref:Uncharacterized protein n=1 Tax=Brassica cretica TaxID=69181 RepID=A0A8S9JFU4_BRACR|nr:hypothetical protein F2Q68_00006775 [Brassica cretica]